MLKYQGKLKDLKKKLQISQLFLKIQLIQKFQNLLSFMKNNIVKRMTLEY